MGLRGATVDTLRLIRIIAEAILARGHRADWKSSTRASSTS